MSIRRIARAFTRLQRLFKPLPGICCLCRHPRIRGLETAVANCFRDGILARNNQPIRHIRRLQQRMNLFFDKIEAALMRLPKGFVGGEYAELVPIFIQDPHLRDADLEIDA